jgi:hypothetical protein
MILRELTRDRAAGGRSDGIAIGCKLFVVGRTTRVGSLTRRGSTDAIATSLETRGGGGTIGPCALRDGCEGGGCDGV